MKIVLETNDPAPDMSAKMLVQFARKKKNVKKSFNCPLFLRT